MTDIYEYLSHARLQDLMREAQVARLTRCLRPSRPWRRLGRRPCV
jgi:hypothetical protein